MAEVVSVVQEIVVNANTAPVDALIAAFQEETKAIDQAHTKISNLERILAATSANDIRRRNTINQLIERQKRLIDDATISIGKQAVANDKVTTSLQKQSGALKQQASAYNSLGTNFSRLVQDAPFGFIGIQNNIIPLFDSLTEKITAVRAAGGGTAQVLSSLGASLFSLTSVLSIGISLMTVFGDEIFKSGNKAQKAQKQFDDLSKLLDDAVKAEVDYFKSLGDETDSGEAALKRRVALLKAQRAEDNVVRAAEKELATERTKNVEREISLYEELQDASITYSASQLRDAVATNRKYFAIVQKAKEDEIDLTEFITSKLIQLRSKLKSVDGENAIDEANFEKDQQDKRLKEYEDYLKRKATLGELYRLARSANAPDIKELEEFEKERAFISKEIGKNIQGLKANFDKLLLEDSISNKDPNLAIDLRIQQQQKEQQKEQDKIDEKNRKKRQKAIHQMVDLYESASNTIISYLQSISDAQTSALDREIAYRTEALQRFQLLAEQGNSELLQQELNRIDELNKKREDATQQQVRLNAILVASQQALAVAETVSAMASAIKSSTPGDPYTVPLRIAASAAAVLGAFLSIKAAISGAFKDGVVDFQGKGDGRSDSNVVRISHGESVITAAATKQYAPILEAMNAGVFTPKMFTPPTQKQPEQIDLRDKLDTLIDATTRDRVSIRTNFNGNGVAQFIEREKFRTKNRYR